MAPLEVHAMSGDNHRRGDQGQQRWPVPCAETTPTSSRRHDESWVEISSQPSSSSLSSVAGDDTVITGLRIGTSPYPPRRRRLHHQHATTHTAVKTATSSQDEYDETESEEDRLLTSSTENIRPIANIAQVRTSSAMPAADSDSDPDSDADETETALGRPSDAPAFRPQPNAFSHPPSHLTHRHSTPSSLPQYASRSRPPLTARSQTRPRGGPNFMSPPCQADHEAALRASLTTLLSCAAAARGLSKKDETIPTGPSPGVGVIPSSQPVDLRLLPESELMAEPSPSPVAGPRLRRSPPLKRTASDSSAPSAPSSTSSGDHYRTAAAPNTLPTSKSKRTVVAQGAKASPRMAKKKCPNSTAAAAAADSAAAATFMSPTLLTWVVSAGVVVLVSVVGFGAGYVIGREVGRQEAGSALSAASSSSSSVVAAGNISSNCGGDLARSGSGGTLRRFRWGSVGRSVVA